MTIKDRDAVTGEDTDEKRILFRVVSVFDQSQVAPVEGAPAGSRATSWHSARSCGERR